MTANMNGNNGQVGGSPKQGPPVRNNPNQPFVKSGDFKGAAAEIVHKGINESGTGAPISGALNNKFYDRFSGARMYERLPIHRKGKTGEKGKQQTQPKPNPKQPVLTQTKTQTQPTPVVPGPGPGGPGPGGPGPGGPGGPGPGGPSAGGPDEWSHPQRSTPTGSNPAGGRQNKQTPIDVTGREATNPTAGGPGAGGPGAGGPGAGGPSQQGQPRRSGGARPGSSGAGPRQSGEARPPTNWPGAGGGAGSRRSGDPRVQRQQDDNSAVMSGAVLGPPQNGSVPRFPTAGGPQGRRSGEPRANPLNLDALDILGGGSTTPRQSGDPRWYSPGGPSTGSSRPRTTRPQSVATPSPTLSTPAPGRQSGPLTGTSRRSGASASTPPPGPQAPAQPVAASTGPQGRRSGEARANPLHLDALDILGGAPPRQSGDPRWYSGGTPTASTPVAGAPVASAPSAAPAVTPTQSRAASRISGTLGRSEAQLGASSYKPGWQRLMESDNPQ